MAAQTPAGAPNTNSYYELVRGQSFVSVVGTGGAGPDAYQSKGSYMVAGYGSYGALICTFNPGGTDPKKAECKFLDPSGNVKDSYTMVSKR